MAEAKQRPMDIVWEQFTQTPNTPVTGKNPVTKVVNMELAADKSIKTRAGFFSAGLSGTGDIENQIVTSLLNHANTLLIFKQGESIRYWDGGSTSDSIDISGLYYNNINTGTPCSFCVYGGELYVCESAEPSPSSSALFAWDGSVARNLGVPAMSGSIPLLNEGEEQIVSICAAQDFTDGWTGCGYGCQEEGQGQIEYTVITDSDCNVSEEDNTVDVLPDPLPPCQGVTYLCEAANPGFTGRFCWSIPASGCANSRGEKILNCSFRVGLYDPKRNTFGRATKPRAVINFGPDRGRYGMFQYQILCETPDATIPPEYMLAVWCSTPVEVMTIGTYNQVGNLTIGGKRHAMSEHLGGQTFLEGIFKRTGGGNPETPSCQGLCLYKDQMTLANSKPYNYTFDRPIPSKAMCILGDIAIYFNPIANDDSDEPLDTNDMSTWETYNPGRYENLSGDAYRYGAEYSVGHPEQIGRYSDIAETFTALPHLKGDPVAVFNDGGNNMLLTRQGLYAIAFNRGAQIQDLGGPGILSSNSFHPTSSGFMYVADEGPIWLQGGKPISIIRQLGFDGWIDELTDEEKKEVRIGLIEDSKKVLCHLPIPGSNGRYRYLMHDVESSFTSEWWIGNSQNIEKPGTSTRGQSMSSFRSDFGYRFLLWQSSGPFRYNDTMSVGHDNYASMVEMWVNENSNYTKKLNTVTIDFGECNGDIIVKVDTFDNPLQKTRTGNEGSRDSRSITLTKSKLEQRTIISTFMGMRGKFFRIRIYQEASATDAMQVMRVHADVQYDDNPMPIGETVMDGGTP
jgi:hypothetical protein